MKYRNKNILRIIIAFGIIILGLYKLLFINNTFVFFNINHELFIYFINILSWFEVVGGILLLFNIWTGELQVFFIFLFILYAIFTALLIIKIRIKTYNLGILFIFLILSMATKYFRIIRIRNLNRLSIILLICTFLSTFNMYALNKYYPFKYRNIFNYAQEIDVQNAFDFYSKNDVLFIDSRAKSFFEIEHIPNSICIPWSRKIETKLLNSIPKKMKIITYCDHSGCGLAYSLANYLKKEGFKNCYYLKGGLDLWKKSSYPVKKIMKR